MKKIITLLALAGLASAVQANTQTTVSTDYFTFSFDDVRLSSADTWSGNYELQQLVWNPVANALSAANFTIYYGGIYLNDSDTMVLSGDQTAVGGYATKVSIGATSGLNFQSVTYNGPTAGFTGIGKGSVTSVTTGGFVLPTGATNQNAHTSVYSEPVITVDVPGVVRSGYFSTWAQAWAYCADSSHCTAQDYTTGLGISSVNLDITDSVTVNGGEIGATAVYQRSGQASLSVQAYRFDGYVNTAPVPEPESYAMMLAGLGLMATIARRRSKTKAV